MSITHIILAGITLIVAIAILKPQTHTTLAVDSETNTVTATPRHVACLSFLEHADQELTSHQRFQKLMFLLDHDKTHSDSLYSYKKYDYGPYASTLKSDLKALNRHDLIQIRKRPTFGGNTRYSYTLTTDGKKILSTLTDQQETINSLHNRTGSIFNEHGTTPISNLIDHVRDNHYEYWENSVYKY